jgi:hypothetical protein
VSVDDLRRQLRERGYLSHGIERWFALDPWSSRAFWLELVTVSAKAGLLLGLFAALPMVAVMLFRNHPLGGWETLLLTLLYGAAGFVAAVVLLVVVALVLRLRPSLAIDTPRALLGISFAASALLAGGVALWWYRFDAAPSGGELVCGLALIAAFFLVASIAISAALLSFSIYELQRVPAIHQKKRTVPMTIAAALLVAALFLPAYASQERRAAEEPVQVVTTPSSRKVALVAVDGLTFEIFRTRADLATLLAHAEASAPARGSSTTERWASLGTGVPTTLHGVRAVEGVRLRGGAHLLQSVSGADGILLDLAPAIGLARREPLPPTVRKRDFVWEIFAGRGIPSLAVNWWTTDDVRAGALHSIGQTSIFASVHGEPLRVDSVASKRLLDAVDAGHPQFATVYLPALDIILNRLPLDASERLTASVRALDGVAASVGALHARGYDVVLAGLPGDRQAGHPLLAASFPLATSATPFDVAPTLCTLLGFPPSAEMPGRTLAGSEQARIPSYGPRASRAQPAKVNEEYYDNLRSLGYIR